ncbi:PIR Superfamily Protein [Plasmodium ovale curtisi]|uniref:PIR Superfamily Protein n=1 Tax=Plasmodium ovale curtisi TaxID=864141 RepID=A0A1A8X9I6_PLAOA|nr:PIR Superfamily Protein [Plasmodium ovale curtisi]
MPGKDLVIIKNSLLSNLFSHSSYSIFQIGNDTINCTSWCDKTDKLYIRYPNIYKICCSINENLRSIDLSVRDENKVTYSRYLYYWMHEKISKILTSDTENEYRYIMSSLEIAWDNIVKNDYKLDNEKFSAIKDDTTMENVTKFKKLYEYYNDYGNIKEYISAKNSCDLYYSYLTSQNDLYNEISVICSTTDSKCPNFFHSIKNHSTPQSLLDTTPCKKLNTPQERTLPVSGDTYRNHISDHTTPSEISSPSSIIAAVFSLLGIFCIFIFLYKFTPCGFLLRKLISKKNKIKKYIDEQSEQDILENTSRCEEINSKNSKYNVSYL